MYGIAFEAEGERHYWIGGEIFSVSADDAVRFSDETNADATILILRGAGFSSQMQTVSVPEEAD